MVARLLSTLVLFFSGFAISSTLTPPLTTSAQSSQDAVQLKIAGAVTTPLTLTVADLKKMPRTTIHVDNPHEKKSEVYEGVLLDELLHRAGVPYGEKLRGPLMTTYVVAEATDGYRVLFSLAELDTDFMNSEVLVADTLDGSPIDAKRGPLRLVAPHDKRPARWVRLLKSITVSSPKEPN
jgi:DMSO/TMAO reductase YedYZ molybdopterin-dependent catalytic subunit